MTEYGIIIVAFVVLGVVILYLAEELIKYYNFYAVMIAMPMP